jgi:hypothetical protein
LKLSNSKEEKALGIKEDITVAWREEHNIPGTESLLEMIQAEKMQKKGRSDTLSTVFYDSHNQKRARIYVIPE